MDDEAAVATYLRTRDPELFRLLVERHQVRVFRLVASLLGPFVDLDAQDVTQEVFMRAHEKLADFRGDARFGTWLYRLAFNRALEHRRRARFRRPHVSLETRGAAAGLSPDLDDQERRRVVARLLEGLPDVYRSVIHMHYWLGCSIEEIAETLSVPEGTVKSYLSRARQRLRDHARAQGIEGFE